MRRKLDPVYRSRATGARPNWLQSTRGPSPQVPFRPRPDSPARPTKRRSLHPEFEMVGFLRSGARAAKSLVTSMRALSLAGAIKPTPVRSAVQSSQQQTRALSQSLLTSSTAHTCQHSSCSRPSVVAEVAAKSGVAVFQTQQKRGMKIHSAIRKRCEHCKVRQTIPFWCLEANGSSGSNGDVQDVKRYAQLFKGNSVTDRPLLNSQVVRRKANKRQNGYLYVICSANPRHKQRQGFRGRQQRSTT